MGLGDQKNMKKKYSEWGLPGVEFVKGLCRSIFHYIRASHLPYSEKS